MRRIRIEIAGVVQGVGFRPFVYGLAERKGLRGFVRNSSRGVEIEIEGEAVDSFVEDLRSQAPPLSDIRFLETVEVPWKGEREFSILASRDEGRSTHISPDIAPCPDCRKELTDPGDRRYLYPFINCTNCGPRYSITCSVPYDRSRTTMAPFVMCEQCEREYHDPRDRRFHAQPNACRICGPEVEFIGGQKRKKGPAAVAAAVDLLKRGGAVAVKGVGGFHLAVDAENSGAVEKLRAKKRRSNKAFALMAPDIDYVRKFAVVSDEEQDLLLSMERPIVLLGRGNETLPDAVAPGVPEIGFMLPSSPLHELLFFQKPASAESEIPNFRALVMTSGNLGEEPVVKDNHEVMEKLSGLTDAVLHHDREIFMGVDDSVARRFSGRTVFIRRARGYVPSAIYLGDCGPQVMACGADLKNTFTLTTADAAVVSQHIGDMEHYEALGFFEEILANLKSVYRIEPTALAHDLHPGYFSTRWAVEQEDVERHGIQHHFAHIGSVMAEKGLRGKVIGVALDGSGYGGDGTVWGGEFLVADPYGFERLARFRPVPMPGGEAAARKPWQMALSYLADALGEGVMQAAGDLGFVTRHGEESCKNVLRIIKDRRLSPLTSGAGRLFEAVSAILGIGELNTYEGEAAMALESSVDMSIEGGYRYRITDSPVAEVDFSKTLRGLLEDQRTGTVGGVMAARFHHTLAAAVVDMVLRLHGQTGIVDIVLSGGVFQNRILLGKVMAGLAGQGLRAHINTRVPANDAGISLGQAFLLRARLEKK